MTLPAPLAVGILGDGMIVERSWTRSFRLGATMRRVVAVLHWQHGAPSGISRRIGAFKTDGARSGIVEAATFVNSAVNLQD